MTAEGGQRTAGQVLAEYVASRLADGTAEVGTMLSHAELLGALGLSAPCTGYYRAAGQAAKILESGHARSLRAARGEGYAVVAGMGQIDLARQRKKRAHKQIKRAAATARTTDLSLIDPAERGLAAAVADGLAVHEAILRMHSERLAGHEQLLGSLMTSRVTDRAKVERTADEVADLAERLAVVERQMDERRADSA